MSDSIEFVPHSAKQEEIIFSDAQETCAGTGTQYGKSIAGALWFKRQIHSFTHPTDNFLLAAPTYKILNQSALPYFLRAMEGMGTYNSSKAEFKTNWGPIVYVRTGTEPDSIVGIPNVRAAWIDEAGKLSLYFAENLRARVAAMGARVLYTTSPYSRNWIFKDIIKPCKLGIRPEVKLITAASWENPYHALHDPLKRHAERSRMDQRRFDMLYGGEWGQMAGVVYDCFDEDDNVVDRAKVQLPMGTRFFGGIDWGFREPFCLVIRAVTPDGQHYQVSEFYKSGLTITDMVLLAKQQKDVWNIQTFYCDPSQPGSIEEFNRNGLSAQGADNDKRRGLDLHYDLIKTRKYKIFRGTSPYTLDEIESYHYPEPEDLEPDGKAKDPLPVEQFDHAMDANRYLTISTYRTGIKLVPKVPADGSERNESRTQRTARLKKGRYSGQTEDVS